MRNPSYIGDLTKEGLHPYYALGQPELRYEVTYEPKMPGLWDRFRFALLVLFGQAHAVRWPRQLSSYSKNYYIHPKDY